MEPILPTALFLVPGDKITIRGFTLNLPYTKMKVWLDRQNEAALGHVQAQTNSAEWSLTGQQVHIDISGYRQQISVT